MPAVPSYAPRGQSTRGQSRHRPQRVPVFRNDNWPPRPPAQPLPAPSFLGSPDSDTLLKALPTPSFVTPPEDIPPEARGAEQGHHRRKRRPPCRLVRRCRLGALRWPGPIHRHRWQLGSRRC
ncbi:hypothetical protein BN14_05189 [Rhizoctonia solani AG-1 IB]|uniref:Uncharacterized protein n=1 Tax=Thanatephorus cucumeris (strain AG1-IB / isolate 7/3/14) TaxID=1108050 RepID=M5BX32_THACB|nr:hypothetical protein BN14_05189 [Rhizoctonia solani AG-1 IB]